MGIRQAVGAIVASESKVLLVYKVKGAQGKIKGTWDFPKGGIEPQDTSLKEALLRELREETGSTAFEIVQQLDEKIRFAFDAVTQAKLGMESQETTMFLVRYTGDGSDLMPIDDEISEVRFFEAAEVPELLFPEARAFFHQVKLSC